MDRTTLKELVDALVANGVATWNDEYSKSTAPMVTKSVHDSRLQANARVIDAMKAAGLAEARNEQEYAERMDQALDLLAEHGQPDQAYLEGMARHPDQLLAATAQAHVEKSNQAAVTKARSRPDEEWLARATVPHFGVGAAAAAVPESSGRAYREYLEGMARNADPGIADAARRKLAGLPPAAPAPPSPVESLPQDPRWVFVQEQQFGQEQLNKQLQARVGGAVSKADKYGKPDRAWLLNMSLNHDVAIATAAQERLGRLTADEKRWLELQRHRRPLEVTLGAQ